MKKKRRSYEVGHSPKVLVVIECDRAVFSPAAARCAAAVVLPS
jgi:hypothetical protein